MSTLFINNQLIKNHDFKNKCSLISTWQCAQARKWCDTKLFIMSDFMRKISSKRYFKKLKLVVGQMIGWVSAYKEIRGVGEREEEKTQWVIDSFFSRRHAIRSHQPSTSAWTGGHPNYAPVASSVPSASSEWLLLPIFQWVYYIS